MSSNLKLLILLIAISPNLQAGKKVGLPRFSGSNKTQNAGYGLTPEEIAKRKKEKQRLRGGIKHRPESDACGRCLGACGDALKHCCAVTAALALTAGLPAAYLWFKQLE